MTDLTVLVNGIQRNKLAEEDKSIVCQAVIAYYKVLRSVGALGKEKGIEIKLGPVEEGPVEEVKNGAKNGRGNSK